MKLSSMKSLAIAACMLPASFGLVAGQAIAADRNETVRFAAGASSASLSGSLTGYDSVNYRLGASAGQTMQVLLSPSHASCYFNVLPPGSDRAIFIGSTTGNEFAARLRQDGNYTVQVYQMRNAARRGTTCRYDISFEITGGNQAAMVPGDEMDGDDGEAHWMVPASPAAMPGRPASTGSTNSMASAATPFPTSARPAKAATTFDCPARWSATRAFPTRLPAVSPMARCGPSSAHARQARNGHRQGGAWCRPARHGGSPGR
jgi:hypothetical protein